MLLRFAVFCALALAVSAWGRGFSSMNLEEFTQFTDRSEVLGGSASISGREVTQPGLAILDCNNDGLDDIFFPGMLGEPQILLINQGDFTFSENVGPDNGLVMEAGAIFPLALDYDNDGDVDLALSGRMDPIRLFSNNGDCTFEDVTQATFPMLDVWEQLQGVRGFGAGISAGDIDNDGDLDIFQGSLGLTGGNFAPVSSFGGRPILWQNDNGVFSPRITPFDLIPIPQEGTCGASFEDFDEDGWEDIVVNPCGAGGASPLLFWKNVPGTTNPFGVTFERGFVDVSSVLGMNVASQMGSAMSMSWGDYNNDGHFDVLMTDMGDSFPAPLNFPTRLYTPKFEGDCLTAFDEVAEEVGIDTAETGWGAQIMDFDNDGWEDILMAGNYFWIARTTNPGFVYKNVPSRNGRVFEEKQRLGLENINIHGTAFADFDNDGNVDIAMVSPCVTNRANPLPYGQNDCVLPMPHKIFRNEGPSMEGMIERAYLDVRLRGAVPETNYNGIGSLITLEVPALSLEKVAKIRAGSSWASSEAFFAHFGIPMSRIVRVTEAIVRVDWMGSGRAEIFEISGFNRTVTLQEGTGSEVEMNPRSLRWGSSSRPGYGYGRRPAYYYHEESSEPTPCLDPEPGFLSDFILGR